MLNSRALLLATVAGSILQIVMVTAGHSNKSIAGLFAVGGMGFSLVAGLLYAMWARGGSTSSLAVGGLIAGAVCALIGIFVSYMLGDVPMTLLALGTISSAMTGALGGLIGKFLFRAGATLAMLALAIGLSSRSDAQVSPANNRTSAAVATTRDFAWLVGRWQGETADKSGIADVTYAPPAAGLITGMMRLVKGQEILVVELISMVDTPNGVEMRFRHFSSSLDAYETTFKQSMRLKTHTQDRDVFENVVPFEKGVMSTQPRVTTLRRLDANTFVGHSDILGDDGRPGVVEVTYHRVS
jgi:hypothetical protein